MANEKLKDALDKAQQHTTGRLKIYAKTMRGDEEAVAGRERHAESRYKRRWEDGRVAVQAYLSPELTDALDAACGPVRPGKTRIPRQHSRAYMVELLLYRALIDPDAQKLPKKSKKAAWSHQDVFA
jgi:hypothetical protein